MFFTPLHHLVWSAVIYVNLIFCDPSVCIGSVGSGSYLRAGFPNPMRP